MQRCIDCMGTGYVSIDSRLVDCPTCGGSGILRTNKFCGCKLFAKVPYLYILHHLKMNGESTRYKIMQDIISVTGVPSSGNTYNKVEELEKYGYIKVVDKLAKDTLFVLTMKGDLAYQMNIDRLMRVFAHKNLP